MSVPSISEPVRLDTPTGALPGAVVWPSERTRVPVALIHAGSGPTNRDGNSPLLAAPNHSRKYLAEGLAARRLP